MTEWIVCDVCRNVISRHDCHYGATPQPDNPRNHVAGSCPSSNRRQFNDRPCCYCGRTIREVLHRRFAAFEALWSDTTSLSATAGKKAPEGEERSRHMNGITEGNLIICGSDRAVVVASTSAFLICEPEDGGSEFALSATEAQEWSLVGVEAPTLTIERPHVAYHVDGTRIDGYKHLSRLHRNNAERCAGEGYFVATLDPSQFEYVSA